MDLPKFLQAVPNYEYNPETNMFEVTIWDVGADGKLDVTERYAIQPEIYRLIIIGMQDAWAEMERWQGRDGGRLSLVPDGDG